MKLTRAFSELNKTNADIAGGKGASLGEMTQAGIPVPPGFVILSSTFDEFIKDNDLLQEIDAILDKVNHKDVYSVEIASEKIQALIKNLAMSENIAQEISKQFKELNSEYVAVRSSATAEDGVENAWAGQLDSFLNIKEEALLEKVQNCWASLFTPRAIFYRFEKGLHATKISVAVVIQKMVNSEISGIAFSVHPVTEDRNQMIIEAGFGLGEAIVSGQITPDSYIVEKEPRRIIDMKISTQPKGIYRFPTGGNEWKDIPEPKASSHVLNESQIREFADLIIKIENHYGFPCDIEWAFEQGKFYITQSRPITTLSQKESTAKILESEQVLPRWEKILQRNFPPFAMSTSGRFEFEGFKIGPMTWVREREILIKYKTVQMYMIQDPSAFYISNIKDLLNEVHVDFEKAIDKINTDVHEGVRVAPGETLKDLKRLNELHRYMYGVMLIGFDVAIDIKTKIDDLIKNNETEFQSYLATPIEKTGVQREKDAIVDAGKNPSEKILQELEYNFGYIHQDYLGKPWTVSDYKEASDDLAILPSGMHESYDITQYGSLEQYLIRIFRKMIYMYEEGRNAMVRVCWAMKETVAALGCDSQAMLYMTETEVKLFSETKGSYISDELLKGRKEAFAMYFEAGKYYEYTGNEEVWTFIQGQKIEYIWQEEKQDENILKGTVAYKGKVTGKVRLVFTQEEANQVKNGEILVSPMTQVEFLSGIRKCGAIVTDEGGIICHAAIVAREFGKPCILATQKATKIFRNGDLVEVDANNGTVRLIENEKDRLC